MNVVFFDDGNEKVHLVANLVHFLDFRCFVNVTNAVFLDDDGGDGEPLLSQVLLSLDPMDDCNMNLVSSENILLASSSCQLHHEQRL